MTGTNINQSSDIARTLGIDRSIDRTKNLQRWLWITLILAIAAGVITWNLADTDNGVQFKTEAAQNGNLIVTVTATGNLEPTNQVDVGSELSGIIETVEADYNDRVEVGQVLTKLDTDTLKAQVLKSKATLESAKAKVMEAEATALEARLKLNRCEKLAKRQLCSQEDVDTSQAAYARAQAEQASTKAIVAEAQATLDADQTNLEKAVIHSPINGIVLEREVEPGQTVAASFQAPVLFTLAEDLTQMELHVDVDEADVGLVEEGQQATFTVDAYPDRSFPAHITQVRYGSQTVDGVVTYETVLDVDNSDLSLRPGMTATADITVEKVEDVLLVPNAALRFSPPVQDKESSSGSFISQLVRRGPPRSASKKSTAAGSEENRQRVWVLRDGQPAAIDVTIGATDGIKTEVLKGDVEPDMALLVETVSQSR